MNKPIDISSVILKTERLTRYGTAESARENVIYNPNGERKE